MAAAANISRLPETEWAKKAVDQPKKGVPKASAPAAKSAPVRVAPRRIAVRKSTAVARAEMSPLTAMLTALAKHAKSAGLFESAVPPIALMTCAVAAATGIARNERPGTLSA